MVLHANEFIEGGDIVAKIAGVGRKQRGTIRSMGDDQDCWLVRAKRGTRQRNRFGFHFATLDIYQQCLKNTK
jgi:hypothetical protein